MDASDESDLEQRALAAIRDAPRRKAEQNKQVWQEAARRQAEWERRIIAFAVGKVEELLDYRTNPADWKIVTGEYTSSDENAYAPVAHTSLLGLNIKTSVGPSNLPKYLYVQVPRGQWRILTLETFGEALEAWKRSPEPPVAWPSKKMSS